MLLGFSISFVSSASRPHSKATMEDEKQGVRADDADHAYYEDEAFNEPPEDMSLHRGLKARQISMIALGGAVGMRSPILVKAILLHHDDLDI